MYPGSQNVFEGNLKLILGLIWTLIQKYQLRMRGKGSLLLKTLVHLNIVQRILGK